MSYEKLVGIFERLNAGLPEGIPKMSLTETIDMWEEIFRWNKNKVISANVDISLENLIHFYIVEYACFSFSVNNKNVMRETLLYNGLFTIIANTVFTIWNLAMDGLDYSAKVLLRNLLELMLTTLTVLLDDSKKNALMDAYQNNTTKQVWHKHFSIKKMIETISQYKKVKETPLFEWATERYAHFSSYVHNDFLALLALSRSVVDEESEMTNPNICGSYATRTELLLDELAELCYIFDLLFLFIYEEKSKDSNDTTFASFLKNEECWQNAMYLSLLNKAYYEEITSKENSNDQL